MHAFDLETITKDELAELYKDLGSQAGIAKLLHVHTSKIRKKIYELGIPVRKSNPAKKEFALSLLTPNQLIKLYSEQKTIVNIAKYFGTSHQRISKLFKKFNIPFRNRTGNRKYNLNFDYFNKLTNESAYWLGFICADGSISKNRLYIGLKSTDRDHLEKFKSNIGFSGPIIDRIIQESGRKINGRKLKTTQLSEIKINSKRLYKDLSKFMSNKKTYDFRFPNIDPNFISDFCRGYFDGDGCWHIRNNGQIQFSICGTCNFIEKFREILLNNTGIKPCGKNIYKQGKIYVLKFGGKQQSIKIAEWMYKSGGPFMSRKWLIIKHYIDE